nr:aminotransferase class I/II-fold pyridoxal phosphate-dependent enzyme [Gemmobacter sp. 24YEA27]
MLITGGAQNALFMITRLLASGGQKAVVEDPGYTDMTSILRMNGAEVAFVPVDQEGLITEAIPAGSDLIYCTPSGSFPRLSACLCAAAKR